MSIATSGNNLVNGSFIAEIFSKELQREYRNTAVAEAIVNTKSAAPLKAFGDTLTFRVIGSLAGQLQDYVKNEDWNWVDLPDSTVQLTISNAKTLPVRVDDIDEAQSDIKGVLKEYAEEGNYAISDNYDQYVLGKYGDAYASNTYGSDGSEIDVGYDSGEVSPLNVLARMARLLDDQNVPGRGRYAVIPPTFKEVMMNESSKFIDASVMGDAKSAAKNGFFTEYAGFKLYVSNNLTSTTNGKACLFGVRDAIVGCQQITKSKYVDLPTSWGQGWAVLSVYDCEVIKPKGLACAYVKFD